MPVLNRPLHNAKFTLDTSGVSGFFGGDEAIQAMATVHLFEGRRWLGWYNSPGSYTVAKQFGRLATSRWWDGLFPGPNETPAVSFGLDGRMGPPYVAILSGTEMDSGHLGYLTMQKAKDAKTFVEIGWRKTTPCNVAFLELKNIKYDQQVPKKSFWDALLALIPILASSSTCVMCALVADWYSFAMILLGMVSSGVACLVIGSGKLSLDTVQKPAPGAPPGHGIFVQGNTVIVVKGAEENVNAITKGKFLLKICGAPTYWPIGLCSLLLLLQFLFQLLLIPQGSLFGQIMFLSSVIVSWAYNSYLSSLEKEKIQEQVFFAALDKPDMRSFSLGTRTTMSVFVCLICYEMARDHGGIDPEKILLYLIPNNTRVWERWRKKVAQRMKKGNLASPKELATYLEISDTDKSDFQTNDIKLLENLIKDAESAFEGYSAHRAVFESS